MKTAELIQVGKYNGEDEYAWACPKCLELQLENYNPTNGNQTCDTCDYIHLVVATSNTQYSR